MGFGEKLNTYYVTRNEAGGHTATAERAGLRLSSELRLDPGPEWDCVLRLGRLGWEPRPDVLQL